MKKENKGMKKTSNKGFSLVELIVVIAIMGVLMVVLAPQYLKYVEKSRLQKDNSAIAEIAENVKIAVADEQIAAMADGQVISITDSAKTWSNTSLLEKELQSVIGDGVKLTSNTYKGKTVTLTVKLTNGIFTVEGNGLIYTAGTTSTTKATF
jgi:type IV pilus assembly protein PilA